MLVIGLTGSIGMGKTAAAERFRALGVGVFDADAEVHRLYEGPLAADIARAFPGTVVEGRVDRGRLSAALLAAPNRFKDLEALVHPQVRERERVFLAAEHARGAAMAVLEIPLLFESGGDKAVDVTVVVSADEQVQRRRVLERPGMTPAKLDAVLARQMPDAEKRSRADFVVDTSGTVESCHRQIDGIFSKLGAKRGTAFDRFWQI